MPVVLCRVLRTCLHVELQHVRVDGRVDDGRPAGGLARARARRVHRGAAGVRHAHVEPVGLAVALTQLPELHRLVFTVERVLSGSGRGRVEFLRAELARARTVGGEQEAVEAVAFGQPANLVDLLLDLERLEVVELGLVRLERRVHAELANAGAARVHHVGLQRKPRERTCIST